MKKNENQTENIEEVKETGSTAEAESKSVTQKEKPEKSPKRNRFNPRSFKRGTMSVVLTVLFIAAVVVLNVIVGLVSERFDTTADLTDTGIYSLEENTEKYLAEQLTSDVSFTVLTPETEFESRNTAYKQINELLKKMEMASPHISLSYLDLNQNPNYTSQFTSETLSADYIVVESEKTGRHRIISPLEYFLFNEEYLYYGRQVIEGSNIEQAAVSAMMYVSNDDLIRVAFTEGYGEQDSSSLQTLLTRNGYEVETLNLTTTGEIDPDIDFVVMFAPSMDVDNEHLTKLDKFLDNGGAFGKNLLYFASAEQPTTPNIEAFLNDWGISIGNSVIGQSDMNYLISQFTAYAHLQQICDTPYAGNTYGSPLYYYGAYMRPITQIWGDDSRGGVEQQVLIQTYDNAFLYPLDTEEQFDVDTAESGVFIDAIAAYRVHSTTQEISTVAAFGSYQMADASFMSMSNGSNADFFINMFNYISGKEDSITIKSKSFSNVTFDMNVQTATVLGIVLCIVVPVVVIVLGIVIWVRRRHR